MHDHKESALKLLKNYDLKFSGENRSEDPDKFWERLEDGHQDSSIPDRGISALPCNLAILEYRRVMGDKIIESLEAIERLGRKWEQQTDLDRRYVPPPPMTKFHLAAAGFSGNVSRGKIAAIAAQETNVVAAVVQTIQKDTTKESGDRKKRRLRHERFTQPRK